VSRFYEDFVPEDTRLFILSGALLAILLFNPRPQYIAKDFNDAMQPMMVVE
jgi:hypothetical protein